MEESQTWRELLGSIIANDPKERQRIARMLSVNPITLMRWAKGSSDPRQETLKRLLDALPEQREQLLSLLAREYNQSFDVSNDEAAPKNDALTIPIAFYRQILNTFYNAPYVMRSSTIQMAILQQMIAQFDPQEIGLHIFITACVPPGEDQKVRSLRITAGRSTTLRAKSIEHNTMFVGAESLTGYAAISAYTVTVQDHEEDLYWHVTGQMTERSSAVCPILRSDRIAGCLTIASVQPHYFTPGRLSLMKDYVELLNIALEDANFYALQQIALGVMPPQQEQVPVLASIQDCIAQTLIMSMQRGQIMTRTQAEKLVWKQLEQQLLELSFHRQLTQ